MKLKYQNKRYKPELINRKFSINTKDAYRDFKGNNILTKQFARTKVQRHFGKESGSKKNF